jgi:hypothetical protein
MARDRSGQTRQARETLDAALIYNWSEATGDNHEKLLAHILRREAEEQIVPNLSAFLKGEYQPQNDKERIQFFDACFFRKLYVTAASLYAAADPKLTDYLRYNAARCAAQASIGQGKDAAKLDNKERARWRQQALAWLRAELDRWNKRLEGGQPTNRQRVRSFLEQWQRDTDLVGVREADALKKLSAEEQEAWRKLWADVAELLKKSL